MKLKYFLLISLVLVLFLNFLQNREQFFSDNRRVKHLNNLIDEKIKSIIGKYSINTPAHSNKIVDHDIFVQSSSSQTLENTSITYQKSRYYSLIKDKVILTLYYDPMDANSAAFYDDTMVSDEDIAMADKKGVSLETMPKYEQVFKVSDMTIKPWNFFKTLIKNNQNNPYLNNKLLLLEEVKCSVSEMEKCHQVDSKLIDVVSKTKTKIYAKQPPRNENMVDRMPKVILSMYIPISPTENKLIEIEYDGIYSIFNTDNPVNLNEIIKYIASSLDRHLEIKDIDMTITENQDSSKNQIQQKIITHLQHKHGITNFTTLDDKFTKINSEKFMEHPVYLNEFIYKCNQCPQYIKSSTKYDLV